MSVFDCGAFTFARIGAAMFRSAKTLFSYLAGEARPLAQTCDYDRWLVTAALLTRVATVHSELSEVRRKALRTVLQSDFGLDDRAVARVLEEAAMVNRNAIDLYHFTRQLNEMLDDESRNQIVRMMWEVVYADGHANEFETNIIWRAADLLGVSSRQRVELRQLVSAARAALTHSGSAVPQSSALAGAVGK
jgi:uncharacterized tellurite resistance protein B-like protein